MRSWFIVLICLLAASLAVGLTFPGGTVEGGTTLPGGDLTVFPTFTLDHLSSSISVDVGERIHIDAEPTCSSIFVGTCASTDGIEYKFTYKDKINDTSTTSTTYSSDPDFNHVYYYAIYSAGSGMTAITTITVDAKRVYTVTDGVKSYCTTNCPATKKDITVYVTDIVACYGYDTPHYLNSDGNCVEASVDEGNSLNTYSSKAEMEALTRKCYADIDGTITEFTEADGYAAIDIYMPVNSRGELAIQFGDYPTPVPATLPPDYCTASDKIDTSGRSRVKAFSWSSSDYSDSEIVFTLKSYDDTNTLIDTETVSSKGSQPDLEKGQYLEWIVRFNPSSNPHSSMLGAVWLEAEPAPFEIEAVIGIQVVEKENVVWYAKDSISPGQLIESYEWDFGDGTDTSDKGIVIHAYATDNVGLDPYDLKLTVSDDLPSSDSITIPVEVIDA